LCRNHLEKVHCGTGSPEQKVNAALSPKPGTDEAEMERLRKELDEELHCIETHPVGTCD
jgi:hypothetical protein